VSWWGLFAYHGDEALIVIKQGVFFLLVVIWVEAAIGESIDETLGGAETHCEIQRCDGYKATKMIRMRWTRCRIMDKMEITIKKQVLVK
jgi:hypothetical protein